MSKLIVHILDDVTDLQAIACLEQVIKQGKISDNGESYCYATQFATNISVVTNGTKPNGTTTFEVYRLKL